MRTGKMVGNGGGAGGGSKREKTEKDAFEIPRKGSRQ